MAFISFSEYHDNPYKVIDSLQNLNNLNNSL